MQTTIKAIIFDHDGTLVDSESVHCECWNQTIRELSQAGATLAPQVQNQDQPLSFDDYCTHYNGLPTNETAARIATQFKLNTSTKALCDNKIAKLNAQLAHTPFALLPGVRQALDYLHTRKIPMAIASGANRYEVEHTIHAHTLSKYFKTVATKQDVTHNKPAPDVFLLAAKQLNTEPKFCLAIEDSDSGFTAATAAGMPCLRLTPSPSKPLEFKNMQEALNWIQAELNITQAT